MGTKNVQCPECGSERVWKDGLRHLERHKHFGFKGSKELIAMLKGLPKEGRRVFGKATYFTLKHAMWRTRKRLASKLQNPRLEKITFHTFRHWKATMLYHQTKDPYYVKSL